MWKKILGLLLVLFFVMAVVPVIALEECTGDKEKDPECWKRRGKEIQDLLNQNQGQQKTLASTITYLNNKLALTESQIKQTEEELKKLEEDIVTLSVKINRLDVNLNETSTLLIHRVGEAYKRDAFNPSLYLLSTRGLTDFLTRMKYLKLAQQNDKKILLELQSSRDNKQQQKNLKEDKQKKAEDLKKELASKTAVLASQRKSKEQLLEITKNDEKNYQSLLSQTKEQLQKFQDFVNSRGGASILANQTKCNEGWSGCYYNQRDSLWGDLRLGSTGYLMKSSGCFATSVAMLASHNGKNIKPGDIATSPDTINPAGDVIHSFAVNSVNVSITNASKSSLDSQLNTGPVMAELNGGDHFIVILRKDGDTYIMNDPFLENGYNKPLSAGGYSISSITSLRLVSFN